MSRSTILPILGLAGIVLFSVNRAGAPPPVPDDPFYTDGFSESYAEPQPVAAEEPPPPPAPRLKSDVEAEEARKTTRADSAARATRDTAGVNSVPLRVEYVPLDTDEGPRSQD